MGSLRSFAVPGNQFGGSDVGFNGLLKSSVRCAIIFEIMMETPMRNIAKAPNFAKWHPGL